MVHVIYEDVDGFRGVEDMSAYDEDHMKIILQSERKTVLAVVRVGPIGMQIKVLQKDERL